MVSNNQIKLHSIGFFKNSCWFGVADPVERESPTAGPDSDDIEEDEAFGDLLHLPEGNKIGRNEKKTLETVMVISPIKERRMRKQRNVWFLIAIISSVCCCLCCCYTCLKNRGRLCKDKKKKKDRKHRQGRLSESESAASSS